MTMDLTSTIRLGVYVVRGESPSGADLWRAVVVDEVTEDVVRFREGVAPEAVGEVPRASFAALLAEGAARFAPAPADIDALASKGSGSGREP